MSYSYPGVYINEIPSGNHTIVGASTSIAAFVGAAIQGPTDTPTIINSFADFQRQFGGLWSKSLLGYAVNDFFLNGGNQAVIVRVAVQPGDPNTPTGNPVGALTPAALANTSTIESSDNSVTNSFKLSANSVGNWGNQLSVNFLLPSNTSLTDAFNLKVYVNNPITNNSQLVEQYYNLTVDGTASSIDKVLQNSSSYIIVSSATPIIPNTTKVPKVTATPYTFNGGLDGGNSVNPITGDQIASTAAGATQVNNRGIYALNQSPTGANPCFDLLCIPGYTQTRDVDFTVWQQAANYCTTKRAFLLIDAPTSWTNVTNVMSPSNSSGLDRLIAVIGPNYTQNAAVFFPRVQEADPLNNNQLADFGPSGAIAGTIARIDGQRGVWKAPAGITASVANIAELDVVLSDAENGLLNPLGVNCIRNFPLQGNVIWGARTLQGADVDSSDWKYISVRRLALYIENSLYPGLQWAVFEPNAEPLWHAITQSVNSFMNGLFIKGAFQGTQASDAYFVKCDNTTTTQADIDQGIVNILVGFAPVKPAEFVVVTIQQIAGQS